MALAVLIFSEGFVGNKTQASERDDFCVLVVCCTSSNTVLHTIADTTVLLHYHYQILLVHFSRVSRFLFF